MVAKAGADVAGTKGGVVTTVGDVLEVVGEEEVEVVVVVIVSRSQSGVCL